MDVNKLIPITQNTLHEFRLVKEENKLRALYLERWVEHKKKYFSNFPMLRTVKNMSTLAKK